MTKEKFLEKARSIHGYKYNYINIPDKITYKDIIDLEIGGCKYKQRVNKHLLGKCVEKNSFKKTTEDFIRESKKIWGEDRFDYSGFEYEGALKKIKLYDKINGCFINQTASLHLFGYTSKKVEQSDFIRISRLISDDKYRYDNCEYINKTTKVKLICNHHGEFEVSPFNHINYGEVCPSCTFTIFNKRVKSFLNKNYIPYNQQFKFDDFLIPFDFYIKSNRTIIDFTYEENKINDKIKEDYCEENYLNLIRIKYDQINKIDDVLYNNLKNMY